MRGHRLTGLTFLCSLCLVAGPVTGSATQLPEPPPFFVDSFGGLSRADDELENPRGLDVDPLGNFVYVVDNALHRVQKFTATGAIAGVWGAPGDDEGELRFPREVAVTGSRVYVTEVGEVQVFDTSGDFVDEFGTFGTGDGQFQRPWGVAVDSNGNIYVTDRTLGRVQRFRPDHSFDLVFDHTGIGALSEPLGIAIDDADVVYVVDFGSDRVVRFDSTGTPLSEFGTGGQLFEPVGIEAVGGGGSSTTVYVTENGIDRVQRFDGDGMNPQPWGMSGSGPAEFTDPVGVAVAPNGDIYVSDRQRIQQFDPDTLLADREWGRPGQQPDATFFTPLGIAVDQTTGQVYVGDSFNHRVQKFDAGGAHQLTWGERCVVGVDDGGDPDFCDGGFFNANRVAIDSSGLVYVLDAQNHRVQVFDGDGNFMTKWGSRGQGDGQFGDFPFGIAIGLDAGGNETVYVADSGNDRIQRFDLAGNRTGGWGSSGNGDGEFADPRGIAVDAFGNVYVSDSFNHRIQKFPPGGSSTPVLVWGTRGSGQGQLDEPRGLAFDPQRNVYVADLANQRMQKFRGEDGTFLTEWGSLGSGDGEFFRPFGIATDAAGAIYVADSGNHRIQLFQPADSGAPTPVGNGVVVLPEDSQTGTAPVEITFDSVVDTGVTTLSSSTTGPTIEVGFQLGDPPTYYDIQTTAAFVGEVTICVDYSAVDFVDETQLRLLHFEGGAWVDTTVSLDIISGVICGTVDSFSVFAVTQDLLGALSATVRRLVQTGTLSRGQGESLQAQIDSARRHLEWDRDIQAMNALLEFIKMVDIDIRRGRLTPQQGEALTSLAETVIDQILARAS